jgi:hypothetical protein
MVTKRFCAKVSKYYRVNGTNPRASEDRLPCHWQIYWNGIALLDTKSFEDICNGADLAEQLRISDKAAILGSSAS